MSKKVKVTFQGQKRTGGGNKKETESTTFTIPYEDAIKNKDINTMPDDPVQAEKLLPDDDSIESNQFVVHENAPE